MTTTKPTSIDEYVKGFPEDTQVALEQVRATIKQVAPAAQETISYAMPAFTLNKANLVYFAAFKNHIGLYPAPAAVEVFKKEFAGYKTGKGSIQFPLDQLMPLDLIAKIVEFRIKQILEGKKRKLVERI